MYCAYCMYKRCNVSNIFQILQYSMILYSCYINFTCNFVNQQLMNCKIHIFVLYSLNLQNGVPSLQRTKAAEFVLSSKCT